MSDESTELTAEPVDARKLLGMPRVQYITPDFQREFQWAEDQFDQLWSDIRSAAVRDEPHFLGQVILVENNSDGTDQYRIIDGQQRLTTITVFACVLRDYYSSLDGSQGNLVNQTNNLIKFKNSLGEEERRLHLRSSESNDENLEKVVNETISSADGNIGDCYAFFNNKIKSEEKEMVDKIRETIFTGIKMIRTETGNINSAYQVFQTENDRGLDLDAIDLAKSIVFESAARDPEVDADRIKDLWLDIVSILDEVSSAGAKRPITQILGFSEYNCPMSAYPSTFIRRFESIVRNQLSKREESISDLLEFLDEEASIYYNANYPVAHEDAGQLPDEYVQRSRRVRYKNPHSGIVLYYLYKNNKNDKQMLYKLLDLASILTVRLNLNDESQSSKRDPNYVFVRKIRDRNDPIEAAKSVIRQQTPADTALVEHISTREFKSNDITRLVISELERNHFGKRSCVIPFSSFQIEHIAPRKSFSDNTYTTWRSNFNHNSDKFDQYKNRLGNITMLSEKDNSEAGADPFNEKKSLYSNSDFSITKRVCKYNNWTYKEINERSKDLAELVIDTWTVE